MGKQNCARPLVTIRRHPPAGYLYQRGKKRRWWWKVRLPGSKKTERFGVRRRGAALATTERQTAIRRAWEMWDAAQAGLNAENIGPDPTIAEVVAAFRFHAMELYCDDDGPTAESEKTDKTKGPLLDLYGETPANDFGPKALQAVRRRMIDIGLGLTTINQRVCFIKRIFRWAGSEELIDQTVYAGLLCVRGLTAGRYGLKAATKFRAVAGRDRRLALRYMPRCLRVAVEVQRLAAMRPQDICNMRPVDVDRADTIWVYRPRKHKGAWRGHVRQVAIGPRAQKLLGPYLDACQGQTEYVFSPKKTQAKRYGAMRLKRKSKVQPSQADRSDPDTRKAAKAQYDTAGYRQRIQYAIDMARRDWPDIQDWTPNQLRHAGGDAAREAMGLDAAQAMLGHKHASTTEIYAKVRLQKAKKVARELG